MAFCSFTEDSSKNYITTIPNSFITNYLAEATGDAVKVYLYGLYLCQSGLNMDFITFSKELYMEEEVVRDYFAFWEEYGLVSIISLEPFTVKYLPLGRNSKPRKFKPEKYTEFTKALQVIISDRMIQPNEFSEYFSIMEDNNIRPEALLLIIKYCADLKDSNIGFRYILKVCKDFIARNLTTVDLIEQEIDDYIHRTDDIQRVLTAIGTKRKPEIEDMQLLKKWQIEMGFDIDIIIYSAKKAKIKNIQKLDEFIYELFKNRCFGKKEIEGYLDEKEFIKNTAILVSRTLSVYCEVLEQYIKNYISPWLAKGYNQGALLFIAKYCFKKNRKSFEGMDETVNTLYNQGIVSLESIVSYFENISKDDDFIKELLIIAMNERRPNKFDRETLSQWRDWGFSDEMVKEAAKRSTGRSSPISYMNVILSNWKSKQVFKVEDIPNDTTQIQTRKPFEAQKFGYERTYTQEDFDALIDNIEDTDI